MLVEAIKDPLTHLVRNAVDHGIEPPAPRRSRGKPEAGRLSLRALQDGGMVLVEVDDDGAGIDPGRVAVKAPERGQFRHEQPDRPPALESPSTPHRLPPSRSLGGHPRSVEYRDTTAGWPGRADGPKFFPAPTYQVQE